MLRASLYISLCATRNRLLVRLRRLREPRYLIFALAGAAYMYFVVVRQFGAARPRRRGGTAPDAFAGSVSATMLAAGGVALLASSAAAWVLPMRSTLFDLSEAEIHLLLPAPVTRRALLIHRLLRSQFKSLFGAFILAFVTSPGLAAPGGGSIGARLLRVFAYWIVFVTFRLYFAGVTRVRARLLSTSGRARWTAWAPLAAVAAAIAIVGLAVVRSLLETPLESLPDLLPRLAAATGSGLPRVVLWPFMALIQAAFADTFGGRLAGMARALLVMIATLLWVLHSDGVFHATTGDQPDEQPVAGGATVAAGARAINWPLRPSGSTEGVFFWRNGMAALRSTRIAALLLLLIPLIAIGVAGATAGLSIAGAAGPAAGLSLAALAMAAAFTLFGPQGSRSDLRGDLRHLEPLKTWPVRGAAVIRGELSWPLTLLTLCAWLALACGTVFSAAAFPDVPIARRLSLCSAAFLLAPALIGAQLLVHNAAAVLLPGWVPTGTQRARGLDAAGQRLIMFGAVMIGLVAIIAPGALAGAVVALVSYRWIGVAAAVPAAAVCLTVVAVEVLLATEALGRAFDRIDLSAVEPPD
ncbi:MAG: putative ABC exporter domain-containing protein [Acidobacteriota bacterium]